jgi:ABC-type antimicrobial peptide transport system permease subunit
MDLRADAYGNTTLTDNLIATYCKEQGLSLTNNRQTYMALEQEQLQSLILTVTGSVCIGLMALLVLMGLFSLEAEQEKRRYAVLRAIGLSEGQLWGRILGKTLLRGLLTALGGGLIYLFYQLKSAIESAAHPVWEGSQPYQMSLAQAWGQFRSNLIYYGISERLVLLLAAICLVSVILVTLAAKSRLGKETASL